MILLLMALAAIWSPSLRAQEKPGGEWSADLLNQILKAEGPKPETPLAATSAPPAAEVVLRTYQLSNLKVREAGKAQNVLAILNKLLPPGSSINPDVGTNSLHILTTAAAHKAVWDYLSAVDVPETSPAAPAVVPDEVKTALNKLAEAGNQSAKVLNVVGTLRTDVSKEFAAIDARQRQQLSRLIGGGAVFAFVLIITIAWMIRRRAPAEPADSERQTSALALAPDQLATALVPVHDKMRNDMLGLLNEVAIKLQAQHNEQQKLVREQQQQLETARQALADERRQFITEAGTMVVQAVERVDATTAKLARQQDKVTELVQELQNTVRELDETKDDLRDREVELERERAKIAALSLLLEDGAALPAGALVNGHGSAPPALGANSNHNGDAGVRLYVAPTTPCTTPDPTTTTTPRVALPPNGNRPETPATPRFTFLPPDQPES